jgi:hypothetical protein
MSIQTISNLWPTKNTLRFIRQRVEAWNEWRKNNPNLKPDLRQADLRPVNLEGADLRGADLWMADLQGAKLHRADLQGAKLWWVDLREADLRMANLHKAFLERTDLEGADLEGANLTGANLTGVYLGKTNLRGADLTGARLKWAQLVGTDLRNATLTGSFIYGVSVWNIQVNEGTKQQNLIITDRESGEAVITVDNIEVAQFIYLLLDNEAIRKVIDAITSKAVLILGRFSDERKRLLDAIKNELRKPGYDYLPIMFDWQTSQNHTTIQTVKTLASLARFVIADLTDARSVPQELQAIVPNFPKLAVLLLRQKSEPEHGMLDEIRSFKSLVEDTYLYENLEEVIASIKENVLGPAEAKVKELRQANKV